MYMKKLDVSIPENEYQIHISLDISDSTLSTTIQELASELVVVVTNHTIHELYPNYIAEVIKSTKLQVETCILPDGEQYKNLETLNLIYNFLFKNNANRNTLIVAFGGGVIGDMAGFAAATFMRGIPYIQVPTTLLAMVDSSVGGKTAVNHPQGKNCIGAFKQPKHVCMHLNFLKTLPQRELIAGYMELIKHGIIHNSVLFDFLESTPNPLGVIEPLNLNILEKVVADSCLVKAEVVSKDEKEKGLRATLNFGHTLAHLIETHTNYSTYLHGEAVGVGMVFATYVSYELKLLAEEPYQKILNLLKAFVPPITIPLIEYPLFKELILHDKKSYDNTVNFIVVEGIGKCLIRSNTTPDDLWEFFIKFLHTHSWACQMNP